MRRAFERIAKECGGTAYTYTWMAIAWAKPKGHVPLTLNRTESGREVPFWASAVLRGLTEDEDDWHRGRMLPLAGPHVSPGTNEAPVGNTDSISEAHRLMNARKRGLVLEGAVEMVNWVAGMGLLDSPRGKAKAAAAEARVAPPTTGQAVQGKRAEEPNPESPTDWNSQGPTDPFYFLCLKVTYLGSNYTLSSASGAGRS